MELKPKKQLLSKLTKNKALLGFVLFCHLVSFGQTDFNNLKDYIPYENSPLETHPIITIKVHLHIIQRYADNPQNFTEDNIHFVKEQFGWIGDMYRKFSKPTLLTEGDEYYIPKSRIQFRIDTVFYHIDSTGWDRIKTVINMRGGALWNIDTIDLEQNEIGIVGFLAGRIGKFADSIAVVGSKENNGVYTLASKRQENGMTYLKMNQPIKSNVTSGKISYYYKRDLNCSQDNWRKFTDSDKNALHVFYTGSSASETGFGCGPSPYYLNVSNIKEKQGYSAALLIGHELGHCLGLSHTNYPQFSDLPKHDKFGWIMCNDTNTSNNIMGYNRCRRYLSPLQVAHIHKRYTVDSNLLITTTANEYDTAYNIEIWEDSEWNKAMAIKGDIIVRRGQTLTINENVNMAKGATIYVEKKARVIINGATITNYFGDYWRGVVFCTSYERKNKKLKKKKDVGTITFINKGKFKNVVVK